MRSHFEAIFQASREESKRARIPEGPARFSHALFGVFLSSPRYTANNPSKGISCFRSAPNVLTSAEYPRVGSPLRLQQRDGLSCLLAPLLDLQGRGVIRLHLNPFDGALDLAPVRLPFLRGCTEYLNGARAARDGGLRRVETQTYLSEQTLQRRVYRPGSEFDPDSACSGSDGVSVREAENMVSSYRFSVIRLPR